MFQSHTSTRRTHQNNTDLLRHGLGLAASQTALELDNAGLQLANSVLETGNDIVGNWCHCEMCVEGRGLAESRSTDGWKGKA